jgi:beta-galactosidase
MLNALGYRTTPWNGSATTQLLVVGREALSSGSKLPATWRPLRVTAVEYSSCSKTPSGWSRCGAFVYRAMSRAMCSGASVASGCERIGYSGLARLGRFKQRASAAHADSGQKRRSALRWHWGNRGGVASAAIEKPHLAGWRPILHGEFDMAYSP